MKPERIKQLAKKPLPPLKTVYDKKEPDILSKIKRIIGIRSSDKEITDLLKNYVSNLPLDAKFWISGSLSNKQLSLIFVFNPKNKTLSSHIVDTHLDDVETKPTKSVLKFAPKDLMNFIKQTPDIKYDEGE